MAARAAWLSAILLAEVALLELHGPDGQVVYVNPLEISSLRAPTAVDLHRYFPRGTHCVVSTTNGKFVASVETCAAIRDKLERPGH